MTSMLDTPIQVGPKELRSRLFLPAHQPGVADNGVPGARYIAYQVARARAGLGMQITGATPVAPSRLWSDNCLHNIDDRIVPGYAKLAEAVHAEGGRMLAQLAHPGPTETDGPNVIGPSRIFSQMSRQVVRAANHDELDEVVEQFSSAARRCRLGGLDGIELSLAHGLLLAAFLSPLTNSRIDEYGGSVDARLAFPRRVLKAVRAACGPELILGVRLGADDLVVGGLQPDEAALIARQLEQDVDYINVIVGNNNWLESRVRHWPPTPAAHGLFRDIARTVKEAVSKPVCVVGRVNTAALAEDIIASGDADMVGMVRAHIADPNLLTKAREGRSLETRPCVGVNLCITGGSAIAKGPVKCMVNPEVGIEAEAASRSQARVDRQSAVVVGAGPGGLETAYRLSSYGFSVSLFELSDCLGGQMAAWSSVPSRREVRDVLSWWERQLAVADVEIKTGVRVDTALLEGLDPSIIVLATGAVHDRIPLSIPSDGSVKQLSALEAFDVVQRSGRAVVYDSIGGIDAALVAESLKLGGCSEVSLVTSRVHVCEGEGTSTLFPMIRNLSDIGVRVVERAVPESMQNNSLNLTGLFGEVCPSIDVDLVVPVMGGVSNTNLSISSPSLRAKTIMIGDALRPRRAHHAVHEAYEASVAALAIATSSGGEQA